MSGLRVGGQCEGYGVSAALGGICVGYGGLEMAIEQLLPVRHAWHVEFDENAAKVLKAHWPAVPNYGDVTKVDWASVEPVDVFAGGVPCQGYSLAGKGLGSEDDRDLWPVRKVDRDGVTPRRGALDAIRVMRPRLVVIENVRGMLTSRDGQDFATILADLDDLEYTVSWTTVGACKVGACHHRHRVFIAATLVETAAPLSDPVAHRTGAGWGPAQSVLFGDAGAVAWPASGFTSGGTAWELPVSTCGADEVLPNLLPTPRTSDTNGAGLHGGGGLDLRTAVSMLPTPTARDSARGAGRTFAEGRPLSEVIALLPTPTVADSRGTRNATAGRRPGGSSSVSLGWTLGDVVHARRIGSLLPTPRASDGEKGGPNQRGSSGDVMLPAAVQPERFGKYAAAVHRHELAYGLTAPDPTEPGRNGRPRLAPGFPEWMQGLPAGWLTDVADRKNAIRLAGNGVNPRQAAYALSTLPTFRAAVAKLTSGTAAVAA